MSMTLDDHIAQLVGNLDGYDLTHPFDQRRLTDEILRLVGEYADSGPACAMCGFE